MLISSMSVLDLTRRITLLEKIKHILLTTVEILTPITSSCITSIMSLLESCPKCCQMIVDGVRQEQADWMDFFLRIAKLLNHDYGVTADIKALESSMKIMAILLRNGLKSTSLR